MNDEISFKCCEPRETISFFCCVVGRPPTFRCEPLPRKRKAHISWNTIDKQSKFAFKCRYMHLTSHHQQHQHQHQHTCCYNVTEIWIILAIKLVYSIRIDSVRRVPTIFACQALFPVFFDSFSHRFLRQLDKKAHRLLIASHTWYVALFLLSKLITSNSVTYPMNQWRVEMNRERKKNTREAK